MTQPIFARDNTPPRFPVSIKGVVFHRGRVVLLKNNRNEWELPGGKLELGETPEGCVVREIREELGLDVILGPILDTWLYHIYDGIDVFIATYGCQSDSRQNVVHSNEHKEVGFFSLDELEALTMPDGYKRSIVAWSRLSDAKP